MWRTPDSRLGRPAIIRIPTQLEKPGKFGFWKVPERFPKLPVTFLQGKETQMKYRNTCLKQMRECGEHLIQARSKPVGRHTRMRQTLAYVIEKDTP
jgi:hypothetical protein